MGYSKSYLAQFKGKKVTFKVVTSFPDLKVPFVDSFGDSKVTMASNSSFSQDTITVHILTSFPDVKLQKVSSFGDFEVYLD